MIVEKYLCHVSRWGTSHGFNQALDRMTCMGLVSFWMLIALIVVMGLAMLTFLVMGFARTSTRKDTADVRD
jgi:hypothetical protein